jgi:hypothetical protein
MTIPPLRYSDKAEHMPDGTEIRRLEIDDNFERYQNTRISKLEREVAELTPERRAVFDAGIKARSDAARAALAQSDAEPNGLMRARMIALEQRCERGTPWDVACVTIANKIGEQFGCPPIPTPALAQSDAEPVAWRFKPPFEIYNGYMDIADANGHICTAESPEIATRLLTILNAAYTAPPHPDASAGLVEAAEWHDAEANRSDEMAAASDNHPEFTQAAELHRRSAGVFREWSSAADRSGK